jgi:hypothetical protein
MAKRYGHIGKSAQRDALALLDPAPAPQQQQLQQPEAANPAPVLTPMHPTVQ